MSLTDEINNDIKTAMKAKDKPSLEALRAIKAALLLAATDKGAGESSEAAEVKMHVAYAALGGGIGIGLLGMKAAEATGRNPGAAADILKIAIILAALIEGIVFFAIFLA